VTGRRALLKAGVAAPLGAAVAARAAQGPANTLRVAFNQAEAGFDPARVSDQASVRVLSHIFESPLTYDPLADPAKLVPQTAAALPEVSADFRHFVFTLKPGILFADDPLFGGRPRELTAADYVYSIKRYYDPALKSEHLYQWENAKLLGLSELRAQSIQSRTPFPYDTDVPGLRVLDRYRFEVRLAEPAPRFAYTFAQPLYAGAVAREVVEGHPDPMAHPVGTGPFRLLQWRRASRTVLERNPRFRDERYAAGPPPHDADAQAIARALRGRRLPLLERIEIDIVPESQPRWLAFVGAEHDVMLQVPPDMAPTAVPGGRLAPFLHKRGVRLHRWLMPAVLHTFFNCDDPVVGGNTPEKVALRRAVSLAFDSRLELRLVYQGQGVPAQQMVPPQCYGHDPALVSEMGAPSLAAANALLDTWGYLDRDGDGWREDPEGRPVVLRMAISDTLRGRQSSELWLRRMNAVRLRMRFEAAPFAELIKRSLAGRLMMWGYNWSAGQPDGDFFLGLAYGPNAEQSNDARFRLPAFDRLYERQRTLPDGPERLALMQQCTRLMLAYVPYIAHHHAVANDLFQPRVAAFRRHPFISDWGRAALIEDA
jgi:ABC-type transport system substrate-binding protein